MRNILYIFLFITGIINAQHLPVSSFSPVVEDYLNQCSTKPTIKTLVAINKGTNTLVNTGDWVKVDRCWLFCQESNTSGLLISIANPASTAITIVGSPTWGSGSGYTCGSGIYLDSKYAPSTDGVNYVQNLAYIGLYGKGTGDATTRTQIGLSDGSFNNITGLYTYISGTAYAYINEATAVGLSGAVANIVGYYSNLRTSSTAVALNKNGVSLATGSHTSSAIWSGNFYIGAINKNGTATNFTNQPISFVIIGGGLSDANVYKAEEEIRALMGY